MGFLSTLGFGQKLPNVNKLYDTYVKPWDENPEPLLPKTIKGDLQNFFKPGYSIDKIKDLNSEFEKETKAQIDGMYLAALDDFQIYGSFQKDNILDIIDKVDKNLTRKVVNEIIKQSDPKKFDNEYLLYSIEFGALIGKFFENQSGFYWYYEYPYWESLIVHQKTGIVIPVFHWGFKKFSEYGIEDGFKMKTLKALDVCGK